LAASTVRLRVASRCSVRSSEPVLVRYRSLTVAAPLEAARSGFAPTPALMSRDREGAVPTDRLIIYGESLGGAVAAQLAAEVPSDALILQSTFTTAGDMAGRIAPFFPMRWLIRTRFDTLSRVEQLSIPKLILHARDDEVIPFEMGERLCAAAREPKTCHWFKSGGHNGIWVTMPEEYYGHLRQFLQSILQSKLQSSNSP